MRRSRRWSNLSEWDYREGKGTKVVTRDDHTIGIVREMDVDAASKPDTIVVATGMVRRGHRTIPIGPMPPADSRQTPLTLTQDAHVKLAE